MSFSQCPQRIKQYIYDNRKALLISFCSVFFWGILAHAYGFLHNSLSHDGLNAFIATQTEEIWKIELGRYLVPLYRMVFRGSVALPWVLGILGLLWTSVAAFLVNRFFNVRSGWVSFLIAGIMTTNITYISQIATYLYEFDFNAFSLALSVSAAYLWHRDKGYGSYIGGVLCLTASVGIYQAYFTVAVTMMVLKSILDLFDGRNLKETLIHGLKGILMLLSGCVLYYLIGKLIYGVSDISAQSRTDVLNYSGSNPVALYLSLIPAALRFFVNRLFHAAYNQKLLIIAIGVTCLGLCCSAIYIFKKNKYSLGRILIIILLVTVLPFAMNCIYFLARGRGVHDLMIYAIWFFYIFVLLFACRFCESDMPSFKLSRFTRGLSYLIICAMLWQNVLIANTAYVKKELEGDATLSVMTRVVSMLEEQESYVAGETPVAFFGIVITPEDIFEDSKVTSITGLYKNRLSISSDSSTYYYNGYEAYFKYVLQHPILFCSDETRETLKSDPRLLEMKSFPSEGCMKMIDGTLVVMMYNYL